MYVYFNYRVNENFVSNCTLLRKTCLINQLIIPCVQNVVVWIFLAFKMWWYGYSLRPKHDGLGFPCVWWIRMIFLIDFPARSGCPSGKENTGCPSLFYKVYTILCSMGHLKCIWNLNDLPSCYINIFMQMIFPLCPISPIFLWTVPPQSRLLY